MPSRIHWLVHVQSKSKKFQNPTVITSPTICVFSIFSLFSLERCKSLELAAQNLGYKNFAVCKIYIFGKTASAKRGKLNLHKQLTMYWKYLIYVYCFLFICIKELTLYHSLVSPGGDQHWIYICLLTWFWHLNKEIIIIIIIIIIMKSKESYESLVLYWSYRFLSHFIHSDSHSLSQICRNNSWNLIFV